MFIRLLLSSLAIALAGITAAQAELQWKQQSFDINATFDDSKIHVDFEFTNTGSEPVTIKDTKTSCGCTVAKLDKKTYLPGESGSVATTFDIGQRVGKQVKHITVTTDEIDNLKGYDLLLTVNIPQAVTLKPRVVTWKRGAPLTSKTVRVTLHDDVPLPIESVVPQNEDADNFTYEIIEVQKDKSYKIKITPKDMNIEGRGRVHLTSSQDEKGILKRHLIYTFIRK